VPPRFIARAWISVYPVAFRDLPLDKRSKHEWIRARFGSLTSI